MNSAFSSVSYLVIFFPLFLPPLFSLLSLFNGGKLRLGFLHLVVVVIFCALVVFLPQPCAVHSRFTSPSRPHHYRCSSIPSAFSTFCCSSPPPSPSFNAPVTTLGIPSATRLLPSLPVHRSDFRLQLPHSFTTSPHHMHPSRKVLPYAPCAAGTRFLCVLHVLSLSQSFYEHWTCTYSSIRTHRISHGLFILQPQHEPPHA